MAITKVITIKADTQGAVKSFDTLGDSIQEQKEITIEFEEELADLERQLKDTGKAAYSLGRADTKKRVSELKDAIKDQRLGLKKLNLERSKVGALKTNIKQQAKLNETYFESKEGLTDINRLTAEFALKLKAVKNITIQAAAAVKKFVLAQSTAFLATGVGLLVAAVTLLVVYWDDVTAAISGADDELKNLNKTAAETSGLFRLLAGNLLAAFKFDGLIDSVKDLKLLRKEFKEIDDAITKLEESGTDTTENITKVIAKYREYLGVQDEIAETLEKLKELDKDDAEYNIEKTRLELTLGNLFKQKLLLGELFEAEEKLNKSKDKDPKKDTQENLGDTQEVDVVDIFEQNQIKIQEIKDFYFLKGLEREIANIERQTQQQVDELVRLGAHKDLIEKVEQDSADRITAIVKQASDASAENEEKTDQSVGNAKVAIAGQTANILGGIAKEGSELSKGIAASQATINTFQGVTSALSATSVIPDPFGTILKFANAVAIGVSGSVNVGKILKTKPVTTSIPSGGGATAPPAPSFNLVSGTSDNQLSSDIQGIGNEPMRAVVVSGDVTTAQSLDRNIQTEAGL